MDEADAARKPTLVQRLTVNSLVDASTADDAAVYRIAPDRALVATADFFTPIIDDAYDNTDEAYYWRAWNRHRLRQLPEARAVIDQALARGVSARRGTIARARC